MSSCGLRWIYVVTENRNLYPTISRVWREFLPKNRSPSSRSAQAWPEIHSFNVRHWRHSDAMNALKSSNLEKQFFNDSALRMHTKSAKATFAARGFEAQSFDTPFSRLHLFSYSAVIPVLSAAFIRMGECGQTWAVQNCRVQCYFYVASFVFFFVSQWPNSTEVCCSIGRYCWKLLNILQRKNYLYRFGLSNGMANAVAPAR